MANQTRKYKDLNLKFTIHPVKKDITPLTDVAAVKEAVKMLVLTQPYERPFHPEIGSIATSLLFGNIEPLTAVQLQRSIQDVINSFEPRVQLISVDVEMRPDLNAYNARITCLILNHPDPVSLSVLLERTR